MKSEKWNPAHHTKGVNRPGYWTNHYHLRDNHLGIPVFIFYPSNFSIPAFWVSPLMYLSLTFWYHFNISLSNFGYLPDLTKYPFILNPCAHIPGDVG